MKILLKSGKTKDSWNEEDKDLEKQTHNLKEQTHNQEEQTLEFKRQALEFAMIKESLKSSKRDVKIIIGPEVKAPSFTLWKFILWIFALIIFYRLFLAEFSDTYEPSGTFHFKDTVNYNHEAQMSWSSCGTDEYGKITLLEVSPSPINLHKNITFSVNAEVFRDVDAPIKMKIKVERKFLFDWITMPCIESVGSCTYEDVCQLSPYVHNSSCANFPIPNSVLPCNCPIKKAKYYANHSVVNIQDPTFLIPDWLTNGKYRVQVDGYANGTNIGCYKLHFEVKS